MVASVGMGSITNGEIIRNEETGKIERITQKVNGIDIEEMAKAGSEVIKAEGKAYEVKIEKAANTKAALDEMRNKLGAVEVMARSLSNPLDNPLNAADPNKSNLTNILKLGGVVGVTSDGKDIKTVMTATTNDSSIIGTSYKLVVDQLASKDKIVSNKVVADQKATLGSTGAVTSDGVLTINGVDVNITASMTLLDVKNAIVSNVHDVNVELVSADGVKDFTMVISAKDFAKPITLGDQGSGMLAVFGIAESGKTEDDLSAKIRLNVNDDGKGGITLVRDKNVGITDVVPGVLDLKLADNTRVITLDFVDDKSQIIKTLEHLRDTWNELVIHYGEQTKGDALKHEADEKAHLFDNQFAKTMMNNLKIALGSSTINNEGKVTALIDFGINIDSDWTMSLNMKKLDKSLAENYENFKRAVGDYGSSTNPKFRVWAFPKSMTEEITGKDITVEYNKDASGVETAKLTLNGETVNVSGNDVKKGIIKGPVGSVFEGLRIGYVSLIASEKEIPNNTNDTSVVQVTRGAFAKFQEVAEDYTRQTNFKDNKGLVQLEMERLDKETERNEKKIEEIESRAGRQLERDRREWNKIYEQMMEYQNLDFMLDNIIKSLENM